MINLAGDTVADVHVSKELTEAGIDMVDNQEILSGEVPTPFYGTLCGFEFYRLWTYWSVRGDLPLALAEKLYRADEHKVVRVAGHCGAPPPAEWAVEKIHGKDVIRRAQMDEYVQDETSVFLDHQIANGDLVMVSDDHNCAKFVTSYHIDTQGGLNLFARFLREEMTDV